MKRLDNALVLVQVSKIIAIDMETVSNLVFLSVRFESL